MDALFFWIFAVVIIVSSLLVVGQRNPMYSVLLLLVSFAALSGRDYVIPDDVKALAESALAHRIILKTAASIRGVEGSSIVSEMLMSVPIAAPRPSAEVRGMGPA